MNPELAPLRLFEAPIMALYPITLDEANALLERWAHKLGPVDRPFHQEAYALEVGQRRIAVATSGSIVNGPVAGYQREEVVELTRLAAAVPWANRVLLRLWREVCAPAWSSWPIKAAVSYSHNTLHRGDLYRFDGWEKVRDDSRSGGGGQWTTSRRGNAFANASKTLWVWRYADARQDPQATPLHGRRAGAQARRSEDRDGYDRNATLGFREEAAEKA